MKTSTLPTHRRVRLAGVALLVLGWATAVGVYLTAAPEGAGDPVALQREMNQIARLGGTATVQTVKFDLWLASLWHGERLAFTLAVLSAVGALACFWLAGLMAEE
jgi:hypothetical protein